MNKNVVQNAQRQTVRFENNPQASPSLPPLKLPAPDITDPGIVRLGGSNITAAR